MPSTDLGTGKLGETRDKKGGTPIEGLSEGLAEKNKYIHTYVVTLDRDIFCNKGE